MKKTQKSTQPKQTSQKNLEPEQLTFIEHLYELRRRVFWVVALLLITTAVGFQCKDFLIQFVTAPLNGEKLIYLTPGGGFSFIFTLCLYFGALVIIPVVIYQIYRFLQPLMSHPSRKLLGALMVASVLLALLGAAFGYFVAIPAAITFLTNFAGDAVSANLTADSYLNFVMMYLLGLAALFQLPLVIFMIDHVRRFPPGALLSSQRFVVVGAVLAAAIITPTPDVVNQMIIAVPIIIVYQLGVAAVYLRHRSYTTQITRVEPEVSTVITKASAGAAELPRPVKKMNPISTRRSLDGFVRTPTPPKTQPTHSVRRDSLSTVHTPRKLRPIDGFVSA